MGSAVLELGWQGACEAGESWRLSDSRAFSDTMHTIPYGRCSKIKSRQVNFI